MAAADVTAAIASALGGIVHDDEDVVTYADENGAVYLITVERRSVGGPTIEHPVIDEETGEVQT